MLTKWSSCNTHTRLGWVLSGPTALDRQPTPVVSLITTHALRIDSECCDMKELEDTLHSFWKLESLGICEPDKSLCEDFDSMIEFKEGTENSISALSGPCFSFTLARTSLSHSCGNVRVLTATTQNYLHCQCRLGIIRITNVS